MRLSFRQTLSAALALGALVASGAATAGDDLIACRSKGQIKVMGRWTRIAAPPMDTGEGEKTITAFTAAPRDTNRIYVTNGTVIKRSDDGGCTWALVEESLNIGEVPNGQYKADTFLHLAAPIDDQLWATSYDDATNGITRPHVHIFQKMDEGPIEHGMVENGLPAVGMPIALLASTASTDAIYVLIEEPPDPATGSLDPVRRIYTTVTPNDPPELAQIGLIWQQVKAPAGFGFIEGMSLAPGRGLWIRGKDKVALAPDASLEAPVWTEVPVSEGRVVGVDADILGNVLVPVESAQRTPIALTLNQVAKRTGPTGIPLLPSSITHGNRQGTRALSGPAGTWGYDGYRKKWYDITLKGIGALDGLQFAHGGSNRIVLGLNKGYLYRYDLYEGESFAPGAPSITGEGYDKLPHATIKAPTITPNHTVVTVQPGEVEDVPVTFGMPAAVNPLDVYFLVDTTSSMQAAIDSLRSDIKLIAQGIRKNLGQSACFGVGDFKDFDTNTAALDADKVFRTHQRIVCEEDRELPKVTAALNKLQQGGGGDDPEAQTVALSQAISGEGSATPPVAPGQDAGFRPGAYKIIVLISDVWFKTTAAGYPSIDEVSKTLKVNEIKVVNIVIQNGSEQRLNQARDDMSSLADLTGSIAPKGGVDCDGNKKMDQYDVKAGHPLVCVANGSQPNIGPVIISLLLGVEDPGTLAVNVSDPHHVIRGQVRGATSRIVNLKREASLGFTLPVGCVAAQDGQDLPIGLTPTVRAGAVPLPSHVRGQIVVRCRSIAPPVIKPPRVPEPPPPPVEPEPIIPIPPRLPVGIALPPPLNPPAQPVSNINLNAGMSQQEEQQFQIATVTQGAEEGEGQEEVELAMMGLEQDTSLTPVAAFLTGAMVISAAAGVAYRRRLQRTTQTAYARVR